jgi:hypothetical protein
MGTKRAAGLPLRAITISLATPRSKASTKRDRDDLASSMLTDRMALS